MARDINKRRKSARKWAAKQRDLMPDICREYKRLWRLAFGYSDINSKQRSKVWRHENPVRFRNAKSEWRKNNPNKVIDSVHRRRALLKNQTTENCHRKIELLKSLSRFCHWCCDRLTNDNFTLDHVTPLVRGGSHCPNNLVASCKKCNSSRKSKLVEEWEWVSI